MNEVLTIQDVSKSNEGIDTLEKCMLDELEPALEVLTHTFTPGLCSKRWEAKANTLWVSAIHKTRHQFVILQGLLSVWIDGEEILYEAPYHGITEAGTRRVLYIWEDTIFMTFHANPDELNETELTELITEPHDNKLFSEEDKKLLKDIRSKIETKYLTNVN